MGDARKERVSAYRAGNRVRVAVMPLFSTWIYECDQGPAHLNRRLERLAHALMREPKNAALRTNFGGWHYADDLFRIDQPVVDEFPVGSKIFGAIYAVCAHVAD